MTKQSINNYYNKLDQYKRFGGSRNETSIRRAFANLLEEYCLPKNLIIVDEIHLKGSQKRPDGTVKDALQLDWGFWESKDTKDNLDDEVAKKIEIGYPTFNIIFENSEQIILIQEGEEKLRGKMHDSDFLHRVLSAFVEYERPEIKEFHVAIEKFKEDIPDILNALRLMIEKQADVNPDFRIQREKFWNLCKNSINPDIKSDDIREMLIQHILTAEIFDTVFGESHFHRENNIAKELQIVINTFFVGELRRNTLASIDNYYKAIKTEASRIENHHEKQKFLKVIYENFYKAYNPKGADRLGIVYTPNEIVKFMIESTDYLLQKYFGTNLSEKNVEILDPATGTGTFITDIIEFIPPHKLEYKYRNEIHANEIAILPYYIANLNIEFTYLQKMQNYIPFQSIVFVDTLDNLGFHFAGKQQKLYSLTAENLERIKKQNDSKISVIIGNPPYNALQTSFYDENPNKKYPEIDKRIKATYVANSTTQNLHKVYDMYIRFFRWASDRLNEDGIICFISNNSFLNSLTFDGFRKSIEKEFDYAYFVDLGGNIRELSGKDGIWLNEEHTIFGVSAAVGISISYLIRKKSKQKLPCQIHYLQPCDIRATRKEKIKFLQSTSFKDFNFEIIKPKNNNWINLTDNDFDELIPLISKSAKVSKFNGDAIFKNFSLGVATGRDEWVTDFSQTNLTEKIRYFIGVYSEVVKNEKSINRNKIKWDRELVKYLKNKLKIELDEKLIVDYAFRPFVKKKTFLHRRLNQMIYQWSNIFNFEKKYSNKYICFRTIGNTKDFHVLATNLPVNLHFTGDSQCLPLYRYNEKGAEIENITNWGLQQFIKHYENDKITKDEIFYYIYAVLHNPAYRKKYEQNLRRDFPRIPFYQNFENWVSWGKKLTYLHIDYEKIEPFKLKINQEKSLKEIPKTKLKVDRELGEIILDENTSISGIPEKVWQYKLGNRSALEWIVDQYKEKNPSDPTVKEKFNNYKFSDYKPTVIDLIMRICTVSIMTVEIQDEMEKEMNLITLKNEIKA